MSYPFPPQDAHTADGTPQGARSPAIAPPEEDQAAIFLAALLPPSPAERTRAFAALLQVMTAEEP